MQTLLLNIHIFIIYVQKNKKYAKQFLLCVKQTKHFKKIKQYYIK